VDVNLRHYRLNRDIGASTSNDVVSYVQLRIADLGGRNVDACAVSQDVGCRNRQTLSTRRVLNPDVEIADIGLVDVVFDGECGAGRSVFGALNLYADAMVGVVALDVEGMLI
jgi:hypothetical protein